MVKRVTGKAVISMKKDGYGTVKEWWNATDKYIAACLDETDWCRADYEYFRGGGFRVTLKPRWKCL